MAAAADKHGRLTHTADMQRCSHLIRGVTPCKNRSSAGSTVCHNHDPARLAAERAVCKLPRGARGVPARSEVQRISSSQKRMFNPLSEPPNAPPLVLPSSAEEWRTCFADATLPLHIDIGCARGKMMLDLAKAHPNRNFLGIEARDALVREAEASVRVQRELHASLGAQAQATDPAASEGQKVPVPILSNVKFVSANMMSASHLATFVASIRALPGPVSLVSVLFPDPWIRRRHRARRVVQLPLLNALAEVTKSGALLLVSSDVEDVVTQAHGVLASEPRFMNACPFAVDWSARAQQQEKQQQQQDEARSRAKGGSEGDASSDDGGDDDVGMQASAGGLQPDCTSLTSTEKGSQRKARREELPIKHDSEAGDAQTPLPSAPPHTSPPHAVAELIGMRLEYDVMGWALTNVLAPMASEREHVCEAMWRRVFRAVYVRVD
jgi:tRNA (guanine-N7-)-methyltransferase